MNTRERALRRLNALKNERDSWRAHWEDIARYLLPRAGRFTATDRNRGDKRHHSIYDNTASVALRVMASGLMSGMTSPARPWFRLTTADKDLMEYAPVRNWLQDVTHVMLQVFGKSNTYRALHSMYGELGAFGTAAVVVQDDFDHIIHCHPLTCGEFYLATDDLGRVDTLYREFEMTVAQLVDKFGEQALTERTRQQYRAGHLDQWVEVVHVIEPRQHYDAKRKTADHLPWASCYFERAADADEVLRESGFARFPVLAPRWNTTGGDIYGDSPGMEALGDIKQLQHQQLRKAEAIDYQVKPPLQIPDNAKNYEIDTLPGGISVAGGASAQAGIRTAFEVRLDIGALREDIMDVRERIRKSFFSDLFMMLANDTRSGITAREIAERHEEKLLMLGPTLERLHNELLDPLIQIVFGRLTDLMAQGVGVLPPPPPEMQGQNLQVEYVSVLAQAQRAVATQSIDRLLGTVGMLAQMHPSVLDKIDLDQVVDEYSEALGAPPRLIVPDDQVQATREQRAQQQQAAQQAAAMQQMAATAKDLAGADMEGNNLLKQAAGPL